MTDPIRDALQAAASRRELSTGDIDAQIRHALHPQAEPAPASGIQPATPPTADQGTPAPPVSGATTPADRAHDGNDWLRQQLGG